MIRITNINNQYLIRLYQHDTIYLTFLDESIKLNTNSHYYLDCIQKKK